MSNSKPNAAAGTDWTGLLADPDLARNLGKLLQAYRDAPPERREEALLAAMREIKTRGFRQVAQRRQARRVASERRNRSRCLRRPRLPLHLSPISSVLTGDRIGGGIPGSSVLWRSSCASMTRMLPSGAISRTPAWADARWRPRLTSAAAPKSKSDFGWRAARFG